MNQIQSGYCSTPLRLSYVVKPTLGFVSFHSPSCAFCPNHPNSPKAFRNQKGLISLIDSSRVVNKISTWFDSSATRWCTIALSKATIQLLLTTNMSSLFFIQAFRAFQLDHIKWFLENPKSRVPILILKSFIPNLQGIPSFWFRQLSHSGTQSKFMASCTSKLLFQEHSKT